MGGIERKIWLEIVSSVDSGHFQQSDRPLVEAYCRACALERRASEELQVQAVAHGSPSPWLAVYRDAVKAMTALAVKLRLSPRARNTHPLARRRGGMSSVYDEMLLDRTDR